MDPKIVTEEEDPVFRKEYRLNVGIKNDIVFTNPVFVFNNESKIIGCVNIYKGVDTLNLDLFLDKGTPERLDIELDKGMILNLILKNNKDLDKVVLDTEVYENALGVRIK